jgi:hypothetical protein
VKRQTSHIRAAAIATLLFVVFSCLTATAQTATEDQIKAAYLFNFAKFVEWPAEALPDAASVMNFCSLGRSATVDQMESGLGGKSVNGHLIKVHRLGKVDEIKDCQVVFVSTAIGREQQHWLQAAKGRAVLMVGEAPGFARSGGMIGFITENGRVLFEINTGSAEESHLKISSKLLALARIVSSGPEKSGQ